MSHSRAYCVKLNAVPTHLIVEAIYANLHFCGF
jgi:hypothetical protein